MATSPEQPGESGAQTTTGGSLDMSKFSFAEVSMDAPPMKTKVPSERSTGSGWKKIKVASQVATTLSRKSEEYWARQYQIAQAAEALRDPETWKKFGGSKPPEPTKEEEDLDANAALQTTGDDMGYQFLGHTEDPTAYKQKQESVAKAMKRHVNIAQARRVMESSGEEAMGNMVDSILSKLRTEMRHESHMTSHMKCDRIPKKQQQWPIKHKPGHLREPPEAFGVPLRPTLVRPQIFSGSKEQFYVPPKKGLKGQLMKPRPCSATEYIRCNTNNGLDGHAWTQASPRFHPNRSLDDSIASSDKLSVGTMDDLNRTSRTTSSVKKAGKSNSFLSTTFTFLGPKDYYEVLEQPVPLHSRMHKKFGGYYTDVSLSRKVKLGLADYEPMYKTKEYAYKIVPTVEADSYYDREARSGHYPLVYGWGWGHHGQLGQNKSSSKMIPTVLEKCKVYRFEILAAGLSHTLMVNSAGKLYSTGRNHLGQLGHGDSVTRWLPTRLSKTVNYKIVSIACGDHHSMAVADDGQLYTWGWNRWGQLGLGNREDVNVPTPVTLLRNPGEFIVKVSAGWGHSAAVTDRGVLFMWGANDCMQLGDGTTNFSLVPKMKRNMDDTVYVDMDLKGKRTIVLSAGRNVFTWGLTAHGPQQPMPMGSLKRKPVCKVATTSSVFAVLTEVGEIMTWGNGGPALGYDCRNTQSYPRTVEGLQGIHFVDVVGGDEHFLAKSVDGRLFTWGRGESGRLGHDQTDDEWKAREVGFFEKKCCHVICAGGAHSLVIGTYKERPAITHIKR